MPLLPEYAFEWYLSLLLLLKLLSWTCRALTRFLYPPGVPAPVIVAFFASSSPLMFHG